MMRLLCLIAALATPLTAAERYVWWEAEAPAAGNFPAIEAAPQRDLSAGRWIGHPGGAPASGESVFLEYTVEVPESGSWNLYARKFWKHGPFRWRVNDGPWREVTRSVALLDDGDLNWVYAGRADWRAGANTVRIERLDQKGPAFFDCFVATPGVFDPRRALRPEEPWPEAPPGWFTFNTEAGPLSRSVTSLRGLNESTAGERGRVTVGDGRFEQAGQPIRFLAVGLNSDTAALPDHLVDEETALLASLGVNLVRYHSAMGQRDGSDALRLDEKRLDDLFRYQAACKRQGIFTHLSFYFPLWFRANEVPGVEGYTSAIPPFLLTIFNEAWRTRYREMWREALTRRNPYTGLSLAEDPAVLGLELVNEDSVFFWTFGEKNLPPPVMETIERRFAAWAAARHGTLEQAKARWGGALPRDDAGRAQIPPIHEWFTKRGPREQDAVRFLAEAQREAFAEDARFMREQAGFRGLIVGSNWTTANAQHLGALDRWTNTVGDFMDDHGYFAAWRKRTMSQFHMGPGDRFSDRSFIRWESGKVPGAIDPAPSLNFLNVQIAGKPQMKSEYAWLGFNARRAEMPLVTSALAAQAGLDAMVLFSLGSAGGWQKSVTDKWPALTPAELGQYRAAALTFRLGLVPTAKPAATIVANVEEMLRLKGNAYSLSFLDDANRASEGTDEAARAIPPLVHAIGPVVLRFSDSQPTSLEMVNLEEFHDAAAKRLRGASGVIDWRYGEGVFLLTAPASQAAGGYLGAAGEIDLPDLRVRLENEFGVVWAVGLDGQPIARGGRVLLQVMTEQRNHGFETKGSPEREIVQVGGPPLLVRAPAGEVNFKGPRAERLRITPLDRNGVPKGPALSGPSLQLQPDTLLYLVESS